MSCRAPAVAAFSGARIVERAKSLGAKASEVEPVPLHFLDKLLAMCRDAGIELKLVIVPMPTEVNAEFERSRWKQVLSKRGLQIQNMNDIFQFHDYFFAGDGVHISGVANEYFQQLIDEYVLDIF